MPKRIQLKRTKGWKMPAGAVKVDRTTKWGNHWKVGHGIDASSAVHRYRCDLMADTMPAALARYAVVAELGGKDLACWCPLDSPCHADVLLALANKE